MGATQHVVQTSNRRFRDDEFIIPRELTRGCSAIRVRIRFAPVDQPLFPGQPWPEPSAWSEVNYTVYCWVMPYLLWDDEATESPAIFPSPAAPRAPPNPPMGSQAPDHR